MKKCKHEDDSGVTSMDGITCFICNKQLNASQSKLLLALEVTKIVRDHRDTCGERWCHLKIADIDALLGDKK